eukprot:6184163-Pleurochrysis_carterae.AAC.3
MCVCKHFGTTCDQSAREGAEGPRAIGVWEACRAARGGGKCARGNASATDCDGGASDELENVHTENRIGSKAEKSCRVLELQSLVCQ